MTIWFGGADCPETICPRHLKCPRTVGIDNMGLLQLPRKFGWKGFDIGLMRENFLHTGGKPGGINRTRWIYRFPSKGWPARFVIGSPCTLRDKDDRLSSDVDVQMMDSENRQQAPALALHDWSGFLKMVDTPNSQSSNRSYRIHRQRGRTACTRCKARKQKLVSPQFPTNINHRFIYFLVNSIVSVMATSRHAGTV